MSRSNRNLRWRAFCREVGGLEEATRRIYDSGKHLALYTSGFWATNHPPQWIKKIISRCCCVFLSTDSFHQDKVAHSRFMNALSCVRDAGVWIIVQVLDFQNMANQAMSLIHEALGDEWRRSVEINKIHPLTYGRGASQFPIEIGNKRATDFGRCSILACPVVRYDGIVTACCNEGIIMGRGPNRLRRQVRNPGDLKNVFDELYNDDVNRLLFYAGMSNTIKLPTFREFLYSVKDQQFHTICQACWQLQEYTERNPEKNRLKLLVSASFYGEDGVNALK